MIPHCFVHFGEDCLLIVNEVCIKSFLDSSFLSSREFHPRFTFNNCCFLLTENLALSVVKSMYLNGQLSNEVMHIYSVFFIAGLFKHVPKNTS